MNKIIECYVPVTGVLIHFDHLCTAFCRGAESVDADILTSEHVRLARLMVETIERRIKERENSLCPTK